MPSPTPQEVYDAMVAILEKDRRREKRHCAVRRASPSPRAEQAAIDLRYDHMIATLQVPTPQEIAAVSSADLNGGLGPDQWVSS